MYVSLSDELRNAIQIRGKPLKLVDQVSGETYLLIRETNDSVVKASLSRDHLRTIARQHRPPRDWLQGEEEELF